MVGWLLRAFSVGGLLLVGVLIFLLGMHAGMNVALVSHWVL